MNLNLQLNQADDVVVDFELNKNFAPFKPKNKTARSSKNEKARASGMVGFKPTTFGTRVEHLIHHVTPRGK